MESMFKKEDRMQAYAYALERMEQNPERGSNGVCYLLRDFLSSELKYSLDNFRYHDGPYNFPELWRERTTKVEISRPNSDYWFRTNRARINALKRILK